MYQVIYYKTFEKSLRKLVKEGLKENVQEEIKTVIKRIARGERLEISYRDHKLNGEFSAFRECHIRGDLLLVYQIIKKELVLVVIDIGTHSELF